MIYNREESEVAVLGEVQKYKVGIDERNINHIVTILSSNLYSHPMTSFLRETVSNAVDSHIEAGSNEPIILQHTATDISIRDYGTGISPERFNEIYLNIGSSTKRESNDYIGNFGIGRFSCLSVADIANITSFYEGKAYYYVMNKDVDQLHIDLLDVLPTTEPNGVEVKVPIEHWDCHTLRCLAFIDNLYVESESDEYKYRYDIDYFNKRKILTFKTFKAISWDLSWGGDDTEVLIGKIPYKVDYDTLWDYSDDWHRSWRECLRSICPQIEIGQVDITPNREGLLYSERTKKVLKEAYDACIQEVMELWKQACTKEYESIKEYADYLTQYCHDYLDLGGISVKVSNKLSYDACYKKYKEWSNIPVEDRKEIVRSIYNRGIEVLGKLDDNTLRQGARMKSWFTVKKLFQEWLDSPRRKVIAVPSAAGMSSQYFKGFLNEKYPDTINLLLRQLPITLRYIRRVIRESLGITTLSNYTHRKFALQLMHEMLLYVKQRVEVTNIIGSKEYEQYKKDHCVKKDRTYISTEKICFTITPCSGNGSYKQTATLQEIIPFLKKRYFNDVHIVYADLDNPFVSAFQGLCYQNLVIISAAKNKMPLIGKVCLVG